MIHRFVFFAAILALLCPALSAISRAADVPATQPGAAQSRPAATQPLTTQPLTTQPAAAQPDDIPLAVLDFESTAPGNPDLGKQIADVLGASLGNTPGIRVVERPEMSKILQEHALNLAGLVDPAQQVNAGKMVGARIIITGKCFAIDDEIYIIAKIIGTETSLVEPAIVKGPRNAGTAGLILQISQEIARKLPGAGPRLLPPNEAITDPLPGLKARLAGRKLPKVCVNITEHHVGQVAAVRVDPAVETEMRSVLVSAGFTVIDAPTDGDRDKAGIDVVIAGEAFSEFNARIGTLMSCSARAEVKATRRAEAQIIFSDHATTRAVDLAENSAGKTALQKAGRNLAIKLLQHFDATLPPK